MYIQRERERAREREVLRNETRTVGSKVKKRKRERPLVRERRLLDGETFIKRERL